MSPRRRWLIALGMGLALLPTPLAVLWLPRWSGAVFMACLWCEIAGVIVLGREIRGHAGMRWW